MDGSQTQNDRVAPHCLQLAVGTLGTGPCSLHSANWQSHEHARPSLPAPLGLFKVSVLPLGVSSWIFT